jgi:hypothetical protein
VPVSAMLARPARVLIDSYQLDLLADKSLHSITDFSYYYQPPVRNIGAIQYRRYC